MKFKFHLYVQKHRNRTYTVTVLPFYDVNSFGVNLTEIKSELAETIKERIQDMSPIRMQHLEFDPRIYLQKIQIEVRPVDRKKRNKRREKVKLLFSLLVKPQEDGQLYVTVPKLGAQGPSFYVYQASELQQQATIELTSWLDNMYLDQLLQYQYARSEALEVLEVEVALKKDKKRNQPRSDIPGFNDRDADRFWALHEIGINMTAQASEQRFRRAYRRDELVGQIIQVLMHTRNNSILLTGQSESGKTAIFQEVVRRIIRNDVPEELQNREVWLLAPDRVIAGAQYIGTWEERINDLVNECRKKQHILYVTDLTGLLEIGRWSKSDSNVAQALKPHIASGEVIMVGEVSPDRLVVGERLGADFINLFRRIEVPSMSEEESLAVLSNVARDLEQQYDVRIEPTATESATQLARRFLPYRAFPGKSIRLLEETVADRIRDDKEDAQAQSASPFRGSLLRRVYRKQLVKRRHVLESFSRNTGMPEFVINDRSRLDLDVVEQFFLERIHGQNQAMAEMVNLIATIKAGLNDPNQPLGTFLFIGPTGVGKTHMAKTLASYLFGNEDRLIRFDMSEYSDIDGVARLIGAFDKEGELTKQVRTQPFSVVLLDEFEKASPRIYDIFLQVLGEGRLTDSTGRTTFFHNTIVILTSNLGSSANNFGGFGFGKDKSIANDVVNASLVEHYRDQIERYFRPEFVNRLDQIIVFGQLHPDALREIAARELRHILNRDGITRRNLLVEIDDSIIDLVLEEGYSPQFGARPLKREIEKIIVTPLARQLAQYSADDRELLRIGVDRDHHRVQLKTVPIEEAVASVSVSTGIDGGDDQRVLMDIGQLVEGFAVLRRKLTDWMESDAMRQMTAQKTALLAATHSPNFWDHREDARRKLSRFHFMERITTKLDQLYERCEFLEDMALLINRERDLRYQSELVGEFQELQREVLYLEIEMQMGHLPHRHQSMLLINRVGQATLDSTTGAKDWIRQLAGMYLAWAELKDYDCDIYVLADHVGKSETRQFERLSSGNFNDLIKRLESHSSIQEIALCFEGSNVFGFLKGERGIHRQEGYELSGEELARVQVFAIPDGTDIHQWLKDYQNIKLDILQGRRPSPPQEKQTIVRSYSLSKHGTRFIRDMRTGIRTTRVKDVMEKGKLDEFILAILQKDHGKVVWEDRFPPTFPF